MKFLIFTILLLSLSVVVFYKHNPRFKVTVSKVKPDDSTLVNALQIEFDNMSISFKRCDSLAEQSYKKNNRTLFNVYFDSCILYDVKMHLLNDSINQQQ